MDRKEKKTKEQLKWRKFFLKEDTILQEVPGPLKRLNVLLPKWQSLWVFLNK